MEPKIRLKGFQGEWKESAFSESFESLKNNSLSRAELDDSGTVYNIHYGDVLITYNECVKIDKEVKTFVKDAEVARKLSHLCAIKNGDVIFADAAEDNTVGKCTEVIAHEADAIVSGLHTIPCRPKKEFASRYLGYYLNSKAYHDQLLPHIQGTKISSISKRTLAYTHISCPSDKKEQQAIAFYFQHLDSLIQSFTKKIESLKKVKAASLQSMFPREGETIPRVRFKGFEGIWEIIKFSDFAEIHRGLTYTPNNAMENGVRVLRSSNIDEDTFVTSKGDIFVAPNCVNIDYAKKGDILITAANGSPHLVGKHAIIRNTCSIPMVAGGFMYLVNSQESEFLNASMSSNWYYRFLKTGVTGGNGLIGNLSRNDLKKAEFLIPIQKEERNMLADYFTSLDSQISLQTQRLEKLKQIKSACLDNMFV